MLKKEAPNSTGKKALTVRLKPISQKNCFNREIYKFLLTVAMAVRSVNAEGFIVRKRLFVSLPS